MWRGPSPGRPAQYAGPRSLRAGLGSFNITFLKFINKQYLLNDPQAISLKVYKAIPTYIHVLHNKYDDDRTLQ